MTLAEFKYLAANTTQGLLTYGNYVAQMYWAPGYVAPSFGSYGNEVIILFNIYPGNVIRVDAIGLQISNFPLEVLEQVIAIDVKIPGIGPMQNVQTMDSDVPYRQVEKTVNGPYFIYAFSPEDQRIVINSPTTGSEGYEEYSSLTVLEYPSVSFLRRAVDYDLELIINKARESSYIYKCDRVNPTPTSKTNPVNLTNILTNAAPFATIQDSNYTSTPWVNARYQGSKLDTTTNTGTDPFLQGAFFQGAFFTKDVTDSYIENLVATGNITYIDYFAVSKLLTPAYTVESLNLELSTDINTTSSILQTVTSTLPASNTNIAIGDLLQISSKNTGEFTGEVLKVNTPTPPGLYAPYEFLTRNTLSGETSAINTVRSYSKTSREGYLVGGTVYKIVPVQVLQIGKAKTTAVQEGKLKIKGTEGILTLSIDGYVISGSTRAFI